MNIEMKKGLFLDYLKGVSSVFPDEHSFWRLKLNYFCSSMCFRFKNYPNLNPSSYFEMIKSYSCPSFYI